MFGASQGAAAAISRSASSSTSGGWPPWMRWRSSMIIDGTESIESVGRRVFEHVRRVAGGEVLARAEETKHREFQFWAEQSVSL